MPKILNDKPKSKCLTFNILTLSLMAVSVWLIVAATFFQITFDCNLFFLNSDGENNLYHYIPQIPVIVFIGAILGAGKGGFSVLIYILLGLIFPIYALGGGIHYIIEEGFGYIFAYLPAVIIAGKMLAKSHTILRVFATAFFCTLTIHLFGLIYASSLMMIKHFGFGEIIDFIVMQTGIKFLIDFIFCVPAIYGGLILKKLVVFVFEHPQEELSQYAKRAE